MGALTVPHTFYYTYHTANDFDNSEGKASAWQNMFFGTGTYYWLASRCIYCGSEYAHFGLCCVFDTSLYYDDMYYSRDYHDKGSGRVCPVVSIPSSVQVTPYTGTNDSTNPHTVVMTN